jgi:hypothetical protein
MQNKIDTIDGWLLLCRDEDEESKPIGDWYIAWNDLFRTKKEALSFAGLNNWRRPYRAVRGETRVKP